MDTFRLLSRSSGLRLNKSQQPLQPPVPSAGNDGSKGVPSDVQSGGKKRKRDDFNDSGVETRDLDASEIRGFQKQHKIKISDLWSLSSSQILPSSSVESARRKANKRAARLYPQPLQSFAQLRQLSVSPVLMANIERQAYREPTEVQMAALPLLLRQGEQEPDILTVAPTGSGKTLAFLVPLIEKIKRIHRHETGNHARRVGALIVAPTKELVGQIVNEGRKLASETGVKFSEMRKGMRLENGQSATADDETDEDDIAQETLVKSDVLVSTPLLLLNAITGKDSTVTSLPFVHSLVLDEADYLLDPLFRDQVMAIWSACTSSDLRTSLWSATIGSSIEEFATKTIESRTSNQSDHQRPLFRIVIGLKDTSLPTIMHRLVYASTEAGKLMGLRQILHPASSSASKTTPSTPSLRPPFLIFTQTIPRAIALHSELKYDIPASAGGSSRIAVLHSNLSATQRSNTMAEFRQGKIWILITTDLLSRGVDFKGINGVVNYDIPTTVASYIHRAGRTGRAGRQGGICVTLYTREDIMYLKPIANLITASEKKSTDQAPGPKHADPNGIPPWLLAALPELSKMDRKELKQRGVNVRRAVKDSDSKGERRIKAKNRIGSVSGYERKLENRRSGMIAGSKRRQLKTQGDDDDSDDSEGGFEGFGD